MKSLAFVALCLVVSCRQCFADPIFGARVSHMTVPNGADDPKLSVEYWPYEEGFQLPSLKPGQEAMEMVDGSTGSKYQCIIPNITALGLPESEDEGAEASLPLFGQPVSQQQQQRRKGVPEGATRKSPEEILNQMQGLPCTYRMEGWWTYEFCYKDKIRQLHFEPAAENKLIITMEFVLGYYDAAASLAAQKTYENQLAELSPEERSEKKRFHAQVYSGGTECDLTRERRQTEVRFFCEEGGGQQQQGQQQAQQTVNYIKSIKEGSTCRYEVHFVSSLLCAHRDFRTVEQPKNVINCYELASDKPQDSSNSPPEPDVPSSGESTPAKQGGGGTVPPGEGSGSETVEREKREEGGGEGSAESAAKEGGGETGESDEVEMVLGEDEELKALEEELEEL